MLKLINTLLGRRPLEIKQTPVHMPQLPYPRDDRTLYQLRATGKGAAIMGDVTRVDCVLYSSIEKATAEIPRFMNNVTALIACRNDAINRDDCKVDIFPLQVDVIQPKIDHAWMN